MALDRHTLGAHTAVTGYPISNPPAHRYYSGDTSGGAEYFAVRSAWRHGWNEEPWLSGPIPFEQFVAYINEGRGAVCGGKTLFLDKPWDETSTYTGGHGLYINEQLPDGSFWGYDPLARYPKIYPYGVLKRYMESNHPGWVRAAFTRITPKI